MAEVLINKDKCKGCKICINFCPTKHLTLSKNLNKRGVLYIEISKDTKCIGCGSCFLMCPDSCITVLD